MNKCKLRSPLKRVVLLLVGSGILTTGSLAAHAAARQPLTAYYEVVQTSSEVTLHSALKAYYDILKTAVDEHGIVDINQDPYLTWDCENVIQSVQYARLLDFDGDGLCELVFTVGHIFADINCYIYGYSKGSTVLYHSSEHYPSGSSSSGFYFESDQNGIVYFVDYQEHSSSGHMDYYTLNNVGWSCALMLSYNAVGMREDSDYLYSFSVNNVTVSEETLIGAPENELRLAKREDRYLHKNTYEEYYANPESVRSVLYELETRIAPAAQLSSWAIDEVNSAIEAKLVPQMLQSRYSSQITRAEYCALAVTLYEEYSGKEISERESFVDTNDVNVQKMAASSVVNGVGNNRFDPTGLLTREQAAAMLSRLANALGKPLPKQKTTFADNNIIASWAIEGVGQVQAAGIMAGVGANTFAPKSPYTREQSIITMIRLFRMLA